jgi:hypothetical protein
VRTDHRISTFLGSHCCSFTFHDFLPFRPSHLALFARYLTFRIFLAKRRWSSLGSGERDVQARGGLRFGSLFGLPESPTRSQMAATWILCAARFLSESHRSGLPLVGWHGGIRSVDNGEQNDASGQGGGRRCRPMQADRKLLPVRRLRMLPPRRSDLVHPRAASLRPALQASSLQLTRSPSC